ncbi:MAG: nitroreductase family protein [Candidatus Bathyarchaeota archaeon]|nr:MAG: nitroreductase family protein [Candidatus Bathyarchaeota archaeon]
MTYENIIKRRTIRKFKQTIVPEALLIKCVDAARLSPSAMNRQPLEYLIVNEVGLLEEVFSTTNWAGLLPEYFPTKKEMPRAYIIILLNKKISQSCGHDCGIAAMAISMVAHDEGLGSCILGAINRSALRKILRISGQYDIMLAVALGYPAEEPMTDEVQNGNTEYWLDKEGTLHVPKRKLDHIIGWNKIGH